MQVAAVTQAELDQALLVVNQKYADNVQFKNMTAINRTRSRWHVTVRVKNSNGKGARRNKTASRSCRTVNACWHLYGDFMDAILRYAPDAKIKARGEYYAGGWKDFNVGSVVSPVMISECCQC